MAIEGDENVKFFHGILNKKRNQSNIRGIMVNGTWVDDPVQIRKNMERMNSKEEVKRAVRILRVTKLPLGKVNKALTPKVDKMGFRGISLFALNRGLMPRCFGGFESSWTSDSSRRVRVLQVRGINVQITILIEAGEWRTRGSGSIMYEGCANQRAVPTYVRS
ncbi:hypothetical protein Tco_1154512 [Tanacetum coccineum]